MKKLIDPEELVSNMRFNNKKSIENQLKAKGYLLDDDAIKELCKRQEAIEVIKQAKYICSDDYEDLLFELADDTLKRCKEYYEQNSEKRGK